jgi:hypothetical protein
MSEVESNGRSLTPELQAALGDLRERLRRAETVGLAVSQYVVGEIVRTLLTVDVGDLSIASETRRVKVSEKPNDDGSSTVCHTESYHIGGFEVYSHQVCTTAFGTGTGHATVTPQ